MCLTAQVRRTVRQLDSKKMAFAFFSCSGPPFTGPKAPPFRYTNNGYTWGMKDCWKHSYWIGSAALVLLGNVSHAQGTAESSAPTGLGIVFSGGWPGLLILLLLFGLSLTALYLICEHLLTIRRRELMPDGLDTQVRELLSGGKLRAAEKACRDEPSFLSFVMLHGMSEAEEGWPAVEKALEDASAEQAARLFRKIEFLSVIGNLAPMVGLLGTVTGMIIAFQQVAGSQGAAGAGELAEGIYQALVTTVGGLIVAIPSLAAFAFFRNRVDQLVAEASYLAQHACKPLRRLRSTTKSPPRTTPPPVS